MDKREGADLTATLWYKYESMKRILFFLSGFYLLVVSESFAMGTFAMETPKAVQTKEELCASFKGSSQGVVGAWIPVPVDYEDPLSGHVFIYSWTKKRFNPAWKTFIFVDGGPGNHSHESLLDLENWNVIFFDQRGIACSRPERRDIFLSSKFYSSYQTARDIEEIRRFYSISQLSVYGVSYGTVPATIYASLFPAHTYSVVLEGTIFSGDNLFIQPERREQMLQTFFDSLPLKTQDRILELSNRSDIPNNWFSSMGMFMLYLDDPYEKYKTFLKNTIWLEDPAPSLTGILMNQLFDENSPLNESKTAFGMLACKELGGNITGVSFYSVFRGRKLVSDAFNHMNPQCQFLKIPLNDTTLNYFSSRYPVQAPIYYIQGAMGGATVLDQAYLHAKHTAKGKSYLLIADKGGHQPLADGLVSGYDSGKLLKMKKYVLRQALSHQPLKKKSLKSLESVSALKWRTLSVRE